MKNYNTPQAVLNELKARQNRREIDEMVNMEFKKEEINLFNAFLFCVCGVIIVIPTVILSM